MDFKLLPDERKALVAMLTGEKIVEYCKANSISYDRIKKIKMMLFPVFMGRKVFEYSEEAANVIIDFAMHEKETLNFKSIVSQSPESAVCHNPESHLCDSVSADTGVPVQVQDAFASVSKPYPPAEESKYKPMLVDLGALMRVKPRLFETVVRIASAAKDMELATDLLTGAL